MKCFVDFFQSIRIGVVVVASVVVDLVVVVFVTLVVITALVVFLVVVVSAWPKVDETGIINGDVEGKVVDVVFLVVTDVFSNDIVVVFVSIKQSDLENKVHACFTSLKFVKA